jgi:hypothetical protein
MTNGNELTANMQHNFVLCSAEATASSEIDRERRDWVYVVQNSPVASHCKEDDKLSVLMDCVASLICLRKDFCSMALVSQLNSQIVETLPFSTLVFLFYSPFPSPI